MRLALEALQALTILRQPRRQHLDRHVALELGVPGAVDLTHAALAELAGDAVVRDGPTDEVLRQPTPLAANGK